MQFRVRRQTLIEDIWWADPYGDNWGWFSETTSLYEQVNEPRIIITRTRLIDYGASPVNFWFKWAVRV